jgi:hypothetical protein
MDLPQGAIPIVSYLNGDSQSGPHRSEAYTVRRGSTASGRSTVTEASLRPLPPTCLPTHRIEPSIRFRPARSHEQLCRRFMKHRVAPIRSMPGSFRADCRQHGHLAARAHPVGSVGFSGREVFRAGGLPSPLAESAATLPSHRCGIQVSPCDLGHIRLRARFG